MAIGRPVVMKKNHEYFCVLYTVAAREREREKRESPAEISRACQSALDVYGTDVCARNFAALFTREFDSVQRSLFFRPSSFVVLFLFPSHLILSTTNNKK